MVWKGLKYLGLTLLFIGFVFILNSASGITGLVVLKELKVEVSLNLGIGFILSGVVFFAVGESLGENLDKGKKK